MFGVSKSVVSRYFHTWITALAQYFTIQQPHPSPEVLREYVPSGYKLVFGTDKISHLVDSSNIHIDNPTDPDASSGTHSQYYGGQC
jgi:hypothetical protein